MTNTKSFGNNARSIYKKSLHFMNAGMTQVTYLAAALSVRDLIEQVKRKVPESIPIPIEQWTRIQFWSKNLRSKIASYYKKKHPNKDDGPKTTVQKLSS